MDDEVKGRKLSIMNRRRRSSVLQPVGENVADFSFTQKREDDIQEINEKAVTKMGEMGTKSPWLSLWICNFVQFLCGIQFAIYFTSMWPYLSKLDPTCSFDFLGIIVALFSVGQTIASPAFGYWEQKTLSTKHPSAFGLLLTAIGNLLYALLPTIKTNVRYYMMAARILVGLGSGNLGVLRAYIAIASTPEDRNRATALGIAAFVMGQALGPAIQALFSPIGDVGIWVGPVQFNMYTIPAYFMILLSIISTILLYTIFEENYAGIITKDEVKDPYLVLPKFDILAALILIYMWFVQQSIVTTIEVMASPLTIAMFSWNDSEAILYNGIIQSTSCAFSVLNYAIIAYTRIGKINNRKMIIFSLVLFSLHYLINLPWPFYYYHLEYIPRDPNSTVEDTSIAGGCYESYKWCESTTRVPIYLYASSATFIFGLAFPYFATPTGTVYSQVLGPRNQVTVPTVWLSISKPNTVNAGCYKSCADNNFLQTISATKNRSEGRQGHSL